MFIDYTVCTVYFTVKQLAPFFFTNTDEVQCTDHKPMAIGLLLPHTEWRKLAKIIMG